MRRLSPGLRALAGLLSLAALTAVGWLGSKAALGHFADDYRVEVLIGETGQGIVAGTDVVMRGVIVGEVGDIRLDDDLRAVVELVLEPDIAIPERAVFAVTGKTLLGEKQVEIRFDGDVTDGPHVADGALIADASRVVELQDVLAELHDLFDAIDTDDLATVIGDGLGAFDGQGPQIARAVDQGARGTDVFSRSLDDQVSALHDLSLVAEALGPVGDEFDRLARAAEAGLGTLTENQARLQTILTELERFALTLDVVLEVNRPQLDRMIVRGDNVTRVLFAYAEEVGEVVSGLKTYTGGFLRPFQHPGITGNAAPFQIILENPAGDLCGELPAELAAQLPFCESDGEPFPPTGDPPDILPLPNLPDDLPGIELPVPEVPSTPDVPVRQGLDAVVEGILPDLAGGDR